MRFHEQLATLRKARNISQEALAEQLGVSRQAVSKWETGASQPELGNILALCRILEVSPNELLGAGVPSESTPAPDLSATPESLVSLLKARNTSTNTAQRNFLRNIGIWIGCIILLIVLGISLQSKIDKGSAPQIESCYIHETRALENAREFTLKITYSHLPKDQPNQIILAVSPHVQDIHRHEQEITTVGNVGYATFLLPYGADCTVIHQSKAKKTSYQQEILKITLCTAETYDQELLVK